MKINVQSVKFKASQDLHDHIEEKVGKLFKFNDRIIRADVTLFEDGNSHDNQFCEIRLVVPGDDHIAKKNAASYEKAVTETVEVLAKVLRRKKD